MSERWEYIVAIWRHNRGYVDLTRLVVRVVCLRSIKKSDWGNSGLYHYYRFPGEREEERVDGFVLLCFGPAERVRPWRV